MTKALKTLEAAPPANPKGQPSSKVIVGVVKKRGRSGKVDKEVLLTADGSQIFVTKLAEPHKTQSQVTRTAAKRDKMKRRALWVPIFRG